MTKQQAWLELFAAARYFRDHSRDVVVAVGHELRCDVWQDRTPQEGMQETRTSCSCTKIAKTAELLEACARVAIAVAAVESTSQTVRA